MIGGPNGSGKSTLIKELSNQGVNLGVYLNADDIEVLLKRKTFLNLEDYGLNLTQEAFNDFIDSHSGVINKLKDKSTLNAIHITYNILKIENQALLKEKKYSSYIAALITEFFRHELIKNGVSFTMETVMSHPSKVEFLHKAQQQGYRTYLYFLATKSPKINIERVKKRVQKGGHNVSQEKIEKRY